MTPKDENTFWEMLSDLLNAPADDTQAKEKPAQEGCSKAKCKDSRTSNRAKIDSIITRAIDRLYQDSTAVYNLTTQDLVNLKKLQES